MQQADDFMAECAALDKVLDYLEPADYAMPTAFKRWTVDHILQHLHFFNLMADYAAFDPDRFTADYARFTALREAHDGSMVAPVLILLDGLSGPALREVWRGTWQAMHPRFAAADPKARVRWAGPDMSIRSSVTARQMETWAHGQAIHDALGLDRVDGDRIRNIAHLGVSTFGWTFVNRGEAVPTVQPHVRLSAPSGAVWTWGEDDAGERIEGSATEFCQVVAQTRNIADTDLMVKGTVATRWMAFAQCFAGAPNDPPQPGTRIKGPGKTG